MENIEIKDMPQLNLIGCDFTGPFDQIGLVYGKLMSWAGPKGLLATPNLKAVTVYHDDPAEVPENQIRQTAAITVENEAKGEGDFQNLSLPAAKCIVGHFEITAEEFEKAWASVCDWMDKRGITKMEGKPYELYHNNHEEHPEKKFIVDICIPVG